MSSASHASYAFETLLVDVSDGIAVITINRAEKRNALNGAVRSEMIAAFDALRADDRVRVVVITGAGDKAFIAGADIAEFAQRTPIEQRDVMADRREFDEIANCPKPVIAMINGFCLGGGCEVAMACDIRVACASARLGQPEIKLGIIPGGGGTQRLPRLVGTGNAMRLVLTGELIDAGEAQRIGLVDDVVADDVLRSHTLTLAASIASHSPVALRLAKTGIRAASEMSMEAGLAFERELFITAFGSDDKREGVAAFLEKRPPSFKGR
jgi:enoyl-CoA hydratase